MWCTASDVELSVTQTVVLKLGEISKLNLIHEGSITKQECSEAGQAFKIQANKIYSGSNITRWANESLGNNKIWKVLSRSHVYCQYTGEPRVQKLMRNLWKEKCSLCSDNVIHLNWYWLILLLVFLKWTEFLSRWGTTEEVWEPLVYCDTRHVINRQERY